MWGRIFLEAQAGGFAMVPVVQRNCRSLFEYGTVMKNKELIFRSRGRLRAPNCLPVLCSWRSAEL